MKKRRIIARLDVKGPNVVKGIQFECLRVMGKPKDFARNYYEQGADELIYFDIVANLFRRDNLIRIVNEASENIFIPFTIGGGIRTIEDIQTLLKLGADKVAINTAATKNPELIKDAAEMFGSQCIVGSIEAKKMGPNKWEPYIDHGRQSTGLDAVDWAKKLQKMGAGEIIITSVDMDGTEKGYDHELIKAISDAVSIPVIAAGGAGSSEDFLKALQEDNADAVATASLLHYERTDVASIKENLQKEQVRIRDIKNPKRIEKIKDNDYDIVNYNKYLLRQLAQEHMEKATEKAKKALEEEQFNPDDIYDIGIIDYAINNVKSVRKAFELLGKKTRIIKKPEEMDNCRSIVLPGVGAFEVGMNSLKKQNLIEELKKQVDSGKPLLGICLGMQMLFSESEEFGLHKGLDFIKGHIKKLKDPSKISIKGYKIPHIGWNEIELPSFISDKEYWKNSLLKDTKDKTPVYFVHSYYAVPENNSVILATCKYGGQEICAVVKKDNIMATQFHPEKSAFVGSIILKAFCDVNKI